MAKTTPTSLPPAASDTVPKGKIKAHTTDKLVRTIRRYKQLPRKPGEKLQSEVTSTDYTGRLEVYIDLDKLLEHYAAVAFNNENRRFVRGPVEVRVIEMTEVPGTQKTETR